ncbi:MAG: ThiF family adenylyltransferase [Nocardioides sp.]|nr:ThiF family adenylyltransferase [Nocardioides sp.]
MTDSGVSLARRQLRDLEATSDGAIQIINEVPSSAGPTFIVDLDTSGIAHEPGGIRIRDREWFEIWVPPGFPFDVPSVRSNHRRWLRTPHVHYGRTLCLYAATSVEWNPSDGMRGYLHRLTEWLEHAAAGTLDPDDAPLHPPVVYADLQNGRLIVHPDLGDRAPWAPDGSGTDPKTTYAWCVANGKRVDVLEWVDLETAKDRVWDKDPALFHDGHPSVLMPAVMICDEFGFEFPRKAKELSEGLTESGYGKDQLLADIATATVINVELRKKQLTADATAAGPLWDDVDDPENHPLLTAMVVATPSRRPDGTKRLAHIAAWKFDALGSRITTLFSDVRERDEKFFGDLTESVGELAFDWFDWAKLQWMRVMENRPEVTRRRDAGTPASWLADKRVLVLGAGALGGPIAEACVRAGVRELTVADHGIVNPGILVRQYFTDDDIGQAKVTALARRLSAIRSDLDVIPVPGNVRTELFAPGQNLAAYDLVIDATADASVRAAIELARVSATHRPPLVTMVIGHEADRGLVAVNLPTSSGAGLDAFRKVALHAGSGAPGWRDIMDEFFPKTARTELFFPEPGCSDPTFVGSLAQTTALAGMLLHEALTTLRTAEATKNQAGTYPTDGPSLFASAVRLGNASTGHGTVREQWHPDLVRSDLTGAYEVRISQEALAEIRAEVRRGSRIRDPRIETGGMLLGAFDDATGIVNIDRASGPPPDSYLSEVHFQHGIKGTQERVDAELRRSRSTTGFVGFWHSHPNSQATPSKTDEQGMALVVGPDGSSQRALMMIVGGGGQPWADWRDTGNGPLPSTYLRVVPRSAGPVVAGHRGYVGGLDLQLLPPGTYFRGDGGPPVQVLAGGVVRAQPATSHRSLWARFFGDHE